MEIKKISVEEFNAIASTKKTSLNNSKKTFNNESEILEGLKSNLGFISTLSISEMMGNNNYIGNAKISDVMKVKLCCVKLVKNLGIENPTQKKVSNVGDIVYIDTTSFKLIA